MKLIISISVSILLLLSGCVTAPDGTRSVDPRVVDIGFKVIDTGLEIYKAKQPNREDGKTVRK